MIAVTSRDRYLRVETTPRVAALLLVVVAGLVVVSLVYAVTQRHRAEEARQVACRAKIEAMQSRNPFLGRFVIPYDACLGLHLMEGA